MTSPPGDLRLADEAIGGLSAGILGTLIGYPLDLVKTRMQTGVASGGRDVLSIGRHLVQTEGLAGLYKGVGPPLVSLSILNTTTFTQYTYYRERLYMANPGWDHRNLLAGLSCAPFSGLVSTVENLVKTQMQLDNVRARREYRTSWECVTTLVRRHGVAVLYTGHVVNTIREATFLGPYFFLYEGLREAFLTSGGPGGGPGGGGRGAGWIAVAVPVAGGLSGALSWLVSFPLDCVRAGVQGQTLPPSRGAVRVLGDLLRDRGVRGLYAGSSVSVVRAFLVSGSRFGAYEAALWLLRGGRRYERHHD
jgi:solute carrier family 25 carnitine/acylcarnitine transporter 20/29